MVGLLVGASVIVRLDTDEDRGVFGLGLDGTFENIWQDGAYGGSGRSQATPVVRTSVQLGWHPPFTFAQITAQGGIMVPLEVGDGGYVHGAGLIGGVGLGMSTDGSAGPLVTTTMLVPLGQARIEATRWRGDWHASRLSIGPQLPMNCCYYYQ